VLGKYISVNEASKRSGLSVVWIRRLARQGKIEAKRFGRDWLIVARSIDKYVASPRVIGRPKGR
jgi:excisionase family DNA binding protein